MVGTRRHIGAVVAVAGMVGCEGSSPVVAPSRDAAVDASTDAPGEGRLDARPDRTTREPLSRRSLVVGPSSGSDGGSESEGFLTPAFSPKVHDYYVRCLAGENTLSVTMTASEGAQSLVARPVTSPRAPHQTVNLTVTENEAIVAEATTGVETVEYWIRCLPHDFPHLSMQARPGPMPPAGYYLLGNRQVLPGQSGYAMVLDARGVPVWYFRELSGDAVRDVDHVVPGAISFGAGRKGPQLPFLVRTIEPPSRTSTLGPADQPLDLHELQRLPNGHYLVFAVPLTTGVDLTGLSARLPDGGLQAMGTNEAILDCSIVEFAPGGVVAWIWKCSDHFDPAKESTVPLYVGKAPDGADVIDVFHGNSIDVDPLTGNLMVSFRDMDTVVYVDKASGRILWKMGGTTSSKDGAEYLPVDDPFRRQHDARFQSWTTDCAGAHGTVSLFDDETLTRAASRAAVYDVAVRATAPDSGLDCGGLDASFADGSMGGGPLGAKLVWQFRGSNTSVGEGSFRILVDGSRVIGWGDSPPSDVGFSEVDLDGHVLLELHFTDGNSSYRAIKVPASALSLDAMRETAGGAE